MTTTSEQVLNLPLPDNDAGAATIREYLIRLLGELWREGECFSGERPFGNSDWESDLVDPLVDEHLATYENAYGLILQAIGDL
jgi:hypothetical protein